MQNFVFPISKNVGCQSFFIWCTEYVHSNFHHWVDHGPPSWSPCNMKESCMCKCLPMPMVACYVKVICHIGRWKPIYDLVLVASFYMFSFTKVAFPPFCAINMAVINHNHISQIIGGHLKLPHQRFINLIFDFLHTWLNFFSSF